MSGMYVSRRRSVGKYDCCLYGVVWAVKGGGDHPVPRYSYGGPRVELWRASDWLKNDKKRLKIQESRPTRVYLGFIRLKSGTMRFEPMAGLVRCSFDLIAERTCFWPQMDHVHMFLAAVQKITTEM